MSASTADVLTAIKNIVTALATEAANFLNVNGQISVAAITTPTVIKAAPGRVASVSVIIAGSATGLIYDGATVSATLRPLYVIPQAVGDQPYVVNMPASFGILVAPGSGQTVSVSYS